MEVYCSVHRLLCGLPRKQLYYYIALHLEWKNLHLEFMYLKTKQMTQLSLRTICKRKRISCDMSLHLTTLLIPSAHKKAVINLSSRFCSCWLKWQWHLTLKLKAKYNSFWCGFLSFLDTKARVFIKQLKFKIFILWFLILFEMQTMNKRNFLFCVANVKVFLLDNIEQNSSTTLVS